MDIQNLYQSKTVRGVMIGIGIMIVFLLVFKAGTWIGYRKAGFSYRHGDNYYRVFEGPADDRFGMMHGSDFDDALPGGHGAVGKIVRANLPTLTVAGPDNIEKEVIVDNNTEIREFRTRANTSDLKVDEYVMILGEPNDKGQIIAKFIRIMPPPMGEMMPRSPSTSSTTSQ